MDGILFSYSGFISLLSTRSSSGASGRIAFILCPIMWRSTRSPTTSLKASRTCAGTFWGKYLIANGIDINRERERENVAAAAPPASGSAQLVWTLEAPFAAALCSLSLSPSIIDPCFGIFIRADECLSLDEIGQTVSLRGRIVDRMHVEPQFSSEKTGQTYTTHRGTWLGIPGMVAV